MMLKKVLSILMLLSFVLPLHIFAFSETPSTAPGTSLFSSFRTSDGLPNASISYIAEDAQGFLWLGTQGGLVRFDGSNYDLYDNIPFIQNSLSHNQIQTMFIEGDILWIGTYGGLNRFDIKTGDFKSYRYAADKETSLSNDLVISIARDASGRLWVGTQKGLNRFDEQNETFIRYIPDPANPASLPGLVVRDLHLDSKGRFWVATSDGGLALYLPQYDNFMVYRNDVKKADSLPGNAVMSISEDTAGDLWFGCWGFGLAKLEDTVSGSFSSIHMENENRVYVIDTQGTNLIRIGTWGGGLYEYSRQSKLLYSYKADSGPGSIPHDVVYSLFEDSRGTYWVGTNGGGLARVDSDGSQYTTYVHNATNPDSLSSGKVSALLVDSQKTLWVGQYNGGLSKKTSDSQKFIHYRNQKDKASSLANDIVNVLFEDSFGIIWIGTNNGLCQYRPETDDFLIYKPEAGNTNSLASEVIYSMAEDFKGNLWIGTYLSGLEYWDRKTNNFTHFPSRPDVPDAPGDNLIYSLAWDGEGTLWIGMNNGLDKYKNGVFTHYRYSPDNPRGLPSNTVRSLLLSSDKKLWAATVGGGVVRYDAESDSFVHYTKASGLPDNTVKSIVEDKQGTIWVGTARGIAMLPFGESFFRGLTFFSELRDRDFHTGAYVHKTGGIWFGGTNVLYKINPDIIQYTPNDTAIRISRVRLGNSPEDIVLGASRFETIKLRYDGNSLALNLVFMDFRDPERSRFSYFLDGFDKTWRLSEYGRGFINYTNLPGGKYVLRAKAQASNGSWSRYEFQIPVVVSSPPWLSIPAYFLYLGVLIGLGYLLASLRGKKVLFEKVDELTTLKAKLETANARLADLSLIDPLTGLANRRRMDDMLPLMYSDALRKQVHIAIIMADIDFFKDYNDTHGHMEGDKLLSLVGQLLSSCITRSNDLVVRFGGEEFLIALPHTGKEGAHTVAERILEEVRRQLPIRISLGIVYGTPDFGTNVQQMIEKADRALYKAKNSGRDQACIEDMSST